MCFSIRPFARVLAPDPVKAAVEGGLPRGIGVERLRDAPAECRQFEALGLNPQLLLPAGAAFRPSQDPLAEPLTVIRPPGTEFLDAETGGQKSAPERVYFPQRLKSWNEPPNMPAETAYL
jgi:hypothetical protein